MPVERSPANDPPPPCPARLRLPRLRRLRIRSRLADGLVEARWPLRLPRTPKTPDSSASVATPSPRGQPLRGRSGTSSPTVALMVASHGPSIGGRDRRQRAGRVRGAGARREAATVGLRTPDGLRGRRPGRRPGAVGLSRGGGVGFGGAGSGVADSGGVRAGFSARREPVSGGTGFRRGLREPRRRRGRDFGRGRAAVWPARGRGVPAGFRTSLAGDRLLQKSRLRAKEDAETKKRAPGREAPGLGRGCQRSDRREALQSGRSLLSWSGR